jgi:predicted RNase H-like nuclease (RuvC/YqgF family)
MNPNEITFLTILGGIIVAAIGAMGTYLVGRRQSAATTQSAAFTSAATSSAAKTQLEIINIQELWAYAKDLQARYDVRIQKLEEALVMVNTQNNSFVTENAKLNATNTLQAAQIAQQSVQISQLQDQQRAQVSEHNSQLKSLTEERDSLRRELEEARRRIGELERKVRLLQNPGLNMQTESA